MFGSLYPSTLTIQGYFDDVYFDEKDLIHGIAPVGRILKLECNYGTSVNPDFKDPKLVKKSNRGRKPKKKKRTNRRIQGNGLHFNSQITFWVQSLNGLKIYKVKVFRNGTLAIPGGLSPDLSDVKEIVSVVQSSLEDYIVDTIVLRELYPIMRNYKFEIMGGFYINMPVLHNLFVQKKEEHSIVNINYDVERYPGLIIKFNTPTKRNPKKRTTIKIFQRGKVNIDSAISEEGALYYYNWLSSFYTTHAEQILYKPVSHK